MDVELFPQYYRMKLQEKKMTGAQKWAAGCGIGCAFLVIVAFAIGFGTFFIGKEVVQEFQQGAEVLDNIRSEFGRISDFRPAADGTIAAERIRVFLIARETVSVERSNLERTLSSLSGDSDQSGSSTLGKITSGIRLLPDITLFLSARNDALLDVGMGLGEYYYIYALAYFSWLEKSPGDGPSFPLVGDNRGRHDDHDEREVRETRLEDTLIRLNRMLLPMLRNQLSDLSETDSESSWADALGKEIAAMEKDRFLLPWGDGIPEQLTRSLEPFQQEFEASYSEMCNPVETVIQQ
jgi:hypothetical protein